jgi:hypothetical protein
MSSTPPFQKRVDSQSTKKAEGLKPKWAKFASIALSANRKLADEQSECQDEVFTSPFSHPLLFSRVSGRNCRHPTIDRLGR